MSLLREKEKETSKTGYITGQASRCLKAYFSICTEKRIIVITGDVC